MCLICIDFQKQKMTINDARRALREMSESLGDAHTREVSQLISQAEKAQREQAAQAQTHAAAPPPKDP